MTQSDRRTVMFKAYIGHIYQDYIGFYRDYLGLLSGYIGIIMEMEATS